MLDEDVKQFNRFIRVQKTFFYHLHRKTKKQHNGSYDNDLAPTQWKTYYERFSNMKRYFVKGNHKNEANYVSQIPGQFLLAIEKYWKKFIHHENCDGSFVTSENAEDNVFSLFTLSCYTVGRLQYERSKKLNDFTDPAQLNQFLEHKRASIAWEYIVAFFEDNINDPNLLLALGDMCYKAGADYQASNLIKAAWDLLICPTTKMFSTFLTLLLNRKDLDYWIEYLGKSLHTKQNMRIEIRSISVYLNSDLCKQFMRDYIAWALDFDRDEYANSQIADALDVILNYICKDLNKLRDPTNLDNKTLLLCSGKIKKLRKVFKPRLYILLLVCCVWIYENTDKDKLLFFVRCLCVPDLVIKTEIDPIIKYFGSYENVEKLRACLIRNNINSLALAITSALIDRSYEYHKQDYNIKVPQENLLKLENDYVELEKAQKNRFLWRYEPLIDSWVNEISSYGQSDNDNCTAGSEKLDNESYQHIDHTISTVMSYSSQQYLLPSTSPCPLTDIGP